MSQSDGKKQNRAYVQFAISRNSDLEKETWDKICWNKRVDEQEGSKIYKGYRKDRGFKKNNDGRKQAIKWENVAKAKHDLREKGIDL